MEIRAKPRQHRGRLILGRTLVAATVLVVLVLLVLAALGLRPHAVADDTMASSFPRGTLVLTERALVEQVALGDVIAVPAQGSEGGRVARRVIDIDGGRVLLRGDVGGDADPAWWDPRHGELRLVANDVPWLGYAWLPTGDAAPLPVAAALGAVLLAVLLGKALLRRSQARGLSRGTPQQKRPRARATAF